MAMSWVIAGGGTGGHVTPALALGEALRERGERVLFLGSKRGLETKLVPAAGFELTALPSQQVMGRSLLGRVRGVFGIIRCGFAARRELKRVAADVVISVGGYAAMPAILAAIATRTPMALVEPNAIPGRVNRLSSRFARRVFAGFEVATKRLAAGERGRCVGIPLRRSLIDAFPDSGARREATPPYRLLVFGGSQGARQINEAMMSAAARLVAHEVDVEVFHCSGDADLERVQRAYDEAGLRAEVVGFEPNLPQRYLWADLAICRSGALTVAELALAGLPSLLVPYPYAADDHQAANAEELERRGAARRLTGLDAPEQSGDRVAEALEDLFGKPEQLATMSAAARRFARPDAARDIVESCFGMIAGSSGEPRREVVS